MSNLRNTVHLASLALGMSVLAAPLAAETLNVIGYGGSFETGMKSGLIPAFEAQCGCTVNYTGSLSAATVATLLAEKAAPTVDVAIVDDGPQARLQEMDLVAPLDPAKVPNLAKMYDNARIKDDIGVRLGAAALGISANTEAFEQDNLPKITSWADLGREDLREQVTFPSISSTLGIAWLVMMAKINGGDEGNIDPGFAAIAAIKDNTRFYEKSADLSPYYQQGTIVAGLTSNHRTVTLAKSGFPVEFIFPQEGAVASVSTISVVKGAPNPDLAQAFVNFMIDTQAQTLQAETVNFGPFNKEVKLSDEVAANVIYGPEQIEKLYFLDWAKINPALPEWTERWNKEIEAQ